MAALLVAQDVEWGRGKAAWVTREMVIFMTASLIVAICCGIVTYRIAMREARREIEEAFQRHIEAMMRRAGSFSRRSTRKASRPESVDPESKD